MQDWILVLMVPFQGRDRIPFQAETKPDEDWVRKFAANHGIPVHLINYVALDVKATFPVEPKLLIGCNWRRLAGFIANAAAGERKGSKPALLGYRWRAHS
jgi:hypothetical protein